MTVRRTIRKVRRVTWQTQRTLGDVTAALDGPTAYAKRRVRARAYRGTYRATRRVLRALGL